MSDRTSSVILIMLAAAVVCGALLGHFAPHIMQDAGFLGRLSLDFLFILVVPLVVASIVVASATGKRSFPQGRVLGSAFALFASVTLIAIVIALALGLVFQPGSGVDLTGEALPDHMSPHRSPGVPTLIERIFPASFAQLFVPEHLLGLILFSLFFGLVLRRLGRRARAINDLMRALREALQRLVSGYLWVLPVGLLFLVGSAVAGEGFSSRLIAKLGTFTLALAIGLAIQGAVVLPLVAIFVGRANPWNLFRKLLPALTTALGTGSAAATLPVTQRFALDEAGIERNTGSLVLPLGTVLNVCGSAMFVTLGALFVMQTAGASISVVSMLLIAAVALFVPVGLVGVPRGSLLVLMIALQAVDLPLAGYVGLGLLAAFAWFFERLQTVVDVWADVVAAATIAHLTGAEHEAPHQREKGRFGDDDRRGRTQRGRPERDHQSESRARTRPTRDSRSRSGREDRRPRDAQSGQSADRQSKSPFSVPMSERRQDYLESRRPVPDKSDTQEPPASSRPAPGDRPGSGPRSRSQSSGRTERRRPERRGTDAPRDPDDSNARTNRSQEQRRDRDRRRQEPARSSAPKPPARPEPDPDTRTPEQAPAEEQVTVRSKGRLADLTEEAIERERARVNAQLAAMRATLDRNPESTSETEDSESTTTDEGARKDPAAHRSEDDSVQVDYAGSGNGRHGKVDNSEHSGEDATETAQSGRGRYGRSRHRRDPIGSERVEEQQQAKETDSEDAAEEMSDGADRRPHDDSLASRLAVKIAQSANESQDGAEDSSDEEDFEDTDDSITSETSLSFGRKPARRGRALRRKESDSDKETGATTGGTSHASSEDTSEADDSESEQDTEPVASDFDAPKQSFGRGKRRK
jgi:Na+/H+-dicarboxylate symporter